MSDGYVLAIDQGTSGSTALLIDQSIRLVAAATQEFRMVYPQPGWVEQEPEAIWTSVHGAVQAVLDKSRVAANDIAAIGITNQRETCLFWDRDSGEPLQNAIVWQDRRTADRCEALTAAGLADEIRARTGLVIDPYFSGTKAEWMLRKHAGAARAAGEGKLLFGTIDAWLSWRLCGAHVTDATNASRTMLFNLHDGEWDDMLLEQFAVPRACLPEVVDSSQVYGQTQGVGFLPDGIPVAGLIGDQQGALFGQACFDEGMAKCTYGTGAFVLLNTGNAPVISTSGMLGTVAWRLGGESTFALEGSAFIAGAAVRWLRDGLGLIADTDDVEALAAKVPDSGGVVFVPALSGLGAPHWRPDARGLIHGITGGTTRAHIARATLEGIGLQIADILSAMHTEHDVPLSELRVDGGASMNNLMMQLQADLLGLPCVRPAVAETTGLGSGLLAGLATGFWSSLDDVRRSWREDRRFEPDSDRAGLAEMRARWRRAVDMA